MLQALHLLTRCKMHAATEIIRGRLNDGTIIASGIHKQVEMYKYENFRASISCLNRLTTTCTTP